MSKIIHYCWFGNKKLPALARKCLKSWKKYLPDYKIMQWNEKNFDVNMTKFSKSAYDAKKYAFVSDVARIYALKKYGGIYFDTDMLITGRIQELLKDDFFAGWESKHSVAVGVLYAKNPENELINSLWDKYTKLDFDVNNMWNISIPKILTKELKLNYDLKNDSENNQILKNNTVIYSRDYFYPISSEKVPDLFTKNTCMIHYYDGSWVGTEKPIVNSIKKIFGPSVGTYVVKILVKGKHILIYPLEKTRKKRNLTIAKDIYIKNFNEVLNNSNDYLVICRRDWIGVKHATKELFSNVIEVSEINDDNTLKTIATNIAASNLKLLIFSGFDINWKKIMQEVKKINSNIKIKVIWHGSNSLFVEEVDYYSFETLFNLYSSNIVDSIGFVKKSMYELYKRLGYNVEFLYNRVELKEKIDKEENNSNKIKIGIYSSGDRWVKNFYNQLSACSLIENSSADIVPISDKVYHFAEILKYDVNGSTELLSREEMLKRMSGNDINLYVTFTECAPIIPLESFELGVPCITGNNHHYFDDSVLKDYLVVDEVDNVIEIEKKIRYCLENNDTILKEYNKWKQDNDKLSKDSVNSFIKE